MTADGTLHEGEHALWCGGHAHFGPCRRGVATGTEEPSYLAFARADVRNGYATSSGVVRALLERIDRDAAALKAAEARIDKGLAACNRVIDNTDGHKPPGPPHPTREQATAARIRAALTEES